MNPGKIVKLSDKYGSDLAAAKEQYEQQIMACVPLYLPRQQAASPASVLFRPLATFSSVAIEPPSYLC